MSLRSVLYPALLALMCFPSIAGDWTTYAHDPARSGWASDETILNAANVSKLHLQWKRHLNNASFNLSALTAPVVIAKDASDAGKLYVAGSSGTVFALDSDTGDVIWTKSLVSMASPKKGGLQGTFLCPNGVTATPVIDKSGNVLYVIAPDGSLYGLNLRTGKVVFGPMPFVTPFAKSWSLNLYDGAVYTTVSLGCGNGRSGVYRADVRSPLHPSVQQLLLSKAYTAGIWGRGGAIIGDDGQLYGGTADGSTDPSSGDYSNTVVAASLRDLSVSDYFWPKNWGYLKKMDFDVGSASPVWFTWNHRPLLAHGFKEGVVYLMDAGHLGGQDHQSPLYTSPRLGNDQEQCCEGSGIWGGLSSSRDSAGQSWLYVPMGGPPSVHAPKFPLVTGDTSHGSLMAFKVVEDSKTKSAVLQAAWISGNFQYPDPAVIANNVVFALSNGENPDQRGEESRRSLHTHPAVLRALDAATGQELFNSGDAMTTWVHFSALAISDGKVYSVDHDSNIYCFGLGGANILTRSGPHQPSGEDELSTSWIGRSERQGDYLRSWLLRAGGAAALAFLTSLVAILVSHRRFTAAPPR